MSYPFPAEAVPLLLDWYRMNARDLPWRSDPTPYHVWLSEIMLQQTRVEAVRGYYLRFLEALPDMEALACASEEKLLKLWEGLGYYSRARNLQKAAKTDFEKKYVKACAEVTKRIFDTDPDTNPDYTEKGIWNHFGTYEVGDNEGGKLRLLNPVGYHIEWKDAETVDFDGSKLWHTFLLDIWKQAAGDCLWNDGFVPGFSEKKDEDIYGISVHRELDVKDDETVTCAAGTFESCRHVHVQLDGLSGGWGYMGGNMDFWFAPGIGLVRYSRATDCERDNVYELTKYEGTGEGYFPAENGLFRRYEPTDLRGGWHASVEHTYCENDGKLQIIYNIFGTLDRDKYEEALMRIGKE